MNKLFILISFILILTGCATTYNPATQREEIVLIGDSQEISIGKSMVQEVKKQYKLNANQAVLLRINTIGQKLVSVSDRKNIPYHFFAIEDKEINAFALPGGYIFVHNGLLNIATDDELAGVLAHEIGHIAARHPVKKLEAYLGYQIIMSLASSSNQNYSGNLQKITNLGFNLINLGYSRQDERLADKLSIRYVYLAQFKPEAMITLLKKMQAESLKRDQNQSPIFLSSHPPIAERIKNAEEEIVALKSQKELKNSQNLETEAKESNLATKPLNPANIINQSTKEVSNHKGFCPVCKRNYPASHSYCPEHGTKLR